MTDGFLFSRHFWTDDRLTVPKKLTLHSVKNFWHPDTFVVNEKKVAATNAVNTKIKTLKFDRMN